MAKTKPISGCFIAAPMSAGLAERLARLLMEEKAREQYRKLDAEGKLRREIYVEEKLERILKETRRLEIKKLWSSEGQSRNGEERWVNVLARKIS